jgi:endonuclease V-like protein UPF0215 family
VATPRPHILGIDDAPFEKGQRQSVPIIAVMMEGSDLVEGVAIDSFPVDGGGATDHLVRWITGLRFHASLQGVVLGGITMAGLGVVDVSALARGLGAPVLVVTRRHPTNADRIPVVERSPRATRLHDGLYLACAGADPDAGATLARAILGKSHLPEPLRIAHLIARALVTGESRGRV